MLTPVKQNVSKRMDAKPLTGSKCKIIKKKTTHIWQIPVLRIWNRKMVSAFATSRSNAIVSWDSKKTYIAERLVDGKADEQTDRPKGYSNRQTNSHIFKTFRKVLVYRFTWGIKGLSSPRPMSGRWKRESNLCLRCLRAVSHALDVDCFKDFCASFTNMV